MERRNAWKLATDMHARGIAYEPVWTEFVERVELRTGRDMSALKTYSELLRIANGAVDTTTWAPEQRENIEHLTRFSKTYIDALGIAQQIAENLKTIQSFEPEFLYYLSDMFKVPDGAAFENEMQRREDAMIDDAWSNRQVTSAIGAYQTWVEEISNALSSDVRAEIATRVAVNTPEQQAFWSDIMPNDSLPTSGAIGAMTRDELLQLYAKYRVFQSLLPYRTDMENVNSIDFDDDLSAFQDDTMTAYIPGILQGAIARMRAKHDQLVNDAIMSASLATPPQGTPATPDTPPSTTGDGSTTGASSTGGDDDEESDADVIPPPPTDPLAMPIASPDEQAAYEKIYNDHVELFDFYYDENRQIEQVRTKPIAHGVQSAHAKLHVPLDFNDAKSKILARIDEARDANETFRTNLTNLVNGAALKTLDQQFVDEWESAANALDRPPFYETYRRAIVAKQRLDEERYALVRRKLVEYGKQLDEFARLGANVQQLQSSVADAQTDLAPQMLDDHEAKLIAIEKTLTDLVATHIPSGVDDADWDSEKTKEVPDFLKFYVKYARAEIAAKLALAVEEQKRRYVAIEALLPRLAVQKENDTIDTLASIDTSRFTDEQLDDFSNELGRYEKRLFDALRAAIAQSGNTRLLADLDLVKSPNFYLLEYFYREHIEAEAQSAGAQPTDPIVLEYQRLVENALKIGVPFAADYDLAAKTRAIAADLTLATGTALVDELRTQIDAKLQQYANDIDSVYAGLGTTTLATARSEGLEPAEQYIALQTAEHRQNLTVQNAQTLAADERALDVLIGNDIGPLPEPESPDIAATAECIATLHLERNAPLGRLNDELTPKDRKAVLRANPGLLAECEAIASVEPKTDSECKQALITLYELNAKVDAAINAIAASPYRICRSYLARFEAAFGNNDQLAGLSAIDTEQAALEILNDARMVQQLAITQDRRTRIDNSFAEFVRDMSEYRAFQKTRAKLANVTSALDAHIAPAARDAFYALIGYANQPPSGLDAAIEFNDLEQNTTSAYNAFRRTLDDKIREANAERACLRTLVGYRQLVITRRIEDDPEIATLMELTKGITADDVERASVELFDDIIAATDEKEQFLKVERENLDKLLAPIRAFNAAHAVNPSVEVAKQIEAQKTFIRQLAIYARADPPRPL